MILIVAALHAPWCGFDPADTATVHRVDMDGLPLATWETAETATAKCGAEVELIEVRWVDLRTRGTTYKRCRECQPPRQRSTHRAAQGPRSDATPRNAPTPPATLTAPHRPSCGGDAVNGTGGTAGHGAINDSKVLLSSTGILVARDGVHSDTADRRAPMPVIAQLVTAKHDTAEVMYLLAAIVFGIMGARLALSGTAFNAHVWQTVTTIGVTLIAVGLFVS